MTELTEANDILNVINAMLRHYPELLKISKENAEGIEVIGTFPVQQGRQKVEGHYFASTLIKPKDVRLYFFPIYTHPEQFELSVDLQKCLKGKSCFHIKRLNTALSTEIKQMIDRGVTIYQKAGII